MERTEAVADVASLAAAPHATDPITTYGWTRRERETLAAAVLAEGLAYLISEGWTIEPPGDTASGR